MVTAMRPLLLSIALIALAFEPAQAADNFYPASRNPVSDSDLTTTHMTSEMFADQSPARAIKPDAVLAEDDAPLNHPLPQSLERFRDANKVTKEGWTNSLGLLPQPEAKVSLPSPDVRLQERGIHVGAAFHF